MSLPTTTLPGAMTDQQIGQQGEQNEAVDNNELIWTFERVSPLGAVPAVSDEWHVYRACARRANSTALEASEMEPIGVEVAYHDGVSIAAWFPLLMDTRRNENELTGSPWVYFRLRVSPIAPALLLPAGSYYTTIRAASAPHVARFLPLLTVLPPNA